MSYSPGNFRPNTGELIIGLKDRNSKMVNSSFYFPLTMVDPVNEEPDTYLQQAWTQVTQKATDIAYKLASLTVLNITSIYYGVTSTDAISGGMGDSTLEGTMMWLTDDMRVVNLILPDPATGVASTDASGIDEANADVKSFSNYLIANDIRVTTATAQTLKWMLTEAPST